jgi:hypothetical protein
MGYRRKTRKGTPERNAYGSREPVGKLAILRVRFLFVERHAFEQVV